MDSDALHPDLYVASSNMHKMRSVLIAYIAITLTVCI